VQDVGGGRARESGHDEPRTQTAQGRANDAARTTREQAELARHRDSATTQRNVPRTGGMAGAITGPRVATHRTVHGATRRGNSHSTTPAERSLGVTLAKTARSVYWTLVLSIG
jgi:hypothetical protein